MSPITRLLLLMRIVLSLSKLCNVLDFGAKGDGITDDTSAIQKALDTCSSSQTEESIILLPSSYTFYSYPIRFNKNNINLWIDTNSTLYISPIYNNSKWIFDNNTDRYINIIQNGKSSLQNISIFGNGLINGNGQVWYPGNENKELNDRPHTIYINHCQNVSIYNITILNSPGYNIYADQCENVIIHDINITSPPFDIAPNTDGIDIGSKNAHIYNNYVSNGDDCYCLKSGAENVLFENSTAKQAFCVSTGTGATPQIYNATFRNIVCDNTVCGAKIKAKGSEQNGTMSYVRYENITLIDVNKGIMVNQMNQTHIDRNEYNNNVGYIEFDNIVFDGITGTFTQWLGHIDCTPYQPCYNLTFENIYLTTTNKTAEDEWVCSANVYGTAKNVTPPWWALECATNQIVESRFCI